MPSRNIVRIANACLRANSDWAAAKSTTSDIIQFNSDFSQQSLVQIMAEGAIAEIPAASNSRKRCARVEAAAEDVVATGADDDVVAGVSADRGSNVACGSVEPDVAEAVTVEADGAAASVAVFTVYDRTRTINAVANATVSSVRKTERNEIWTRRRT